MSEIGPGYDYHPNDEKCGLIVKPDKEKFAREHFGERAINIATEGRNHLGAAVRSQSYMAEYVSGKVDAWIKEVTQLA